MEENPTRVPKLPLHLRVIRKLLREVNARLKSAKIAVPQEPFDLERVQQAEAALRSMPTPNPEARQYLETHIDRLARTLALVPPPQSTSRALELGCYMQLTPHLHRLCGYREVRGAYYGKPGRTDQETMQFDDGEFSCWVDHFDAERHRFPYPDGHFDLVIAAEVIEHLTYDPMHLLLESRRVLVEGGHLIVTTPNVGSITSVAKTLEGRDNPQIFFKYKRPEPNEEPEMGHVREYTTHELGEAVKAAGFEVNRLFTTFNHEFDSHLALLKFLEINEFSTENRGQQSWCLARKRSDLPVDRYPFFIYSD